MVKFGSGSTALYLVPAFNSNFRYSAVSACIMHVPRDNGMHCRGGCALCVVEDVEIGPRRHICLFPGPAQLPAVIKNGAWRNDIELFYCSLQASSVALPSRLVGGGRTLKQATTALTNKANKDGGRGVGGKKGPIMGWSCWCEGVPEEIKLPRQMDCFCRLNLFCISVEEGARRKYLK